VEVVVVSLVYRTVAIVGLPFFHIGYNASKDPF
jgi:hypothetical protein